jgi:dephospho-CoA kinase
MIDSIIDENDLTEENSEPLLIGITGGIGSGKSTVGTLFAQAGHIVLNADNLAKEIMQQNTDIQSKLLATFGKESIVENGAIDFSFIASIVFAEGNTHLLKELNEIVHPPLLERLFNDAMKAAEQGAEMICIDMALLFEAGLEYGFDYIVGIVSDQKNKVARVQERSHLSEQDILRRMKHQIDDQELINKADFIIDNNGSIHDLEQSVNFLLSFIPFLPNNKHEE